MQTLFDSMIDQLTKVTDLSVPYVFLQSSDRHVIYLGHDGCEVSRETKAAACDFVTPHRRYCIDHDDFATEYRFVSKKDLIEAIYRLGIQSQLKVRAVADAVFSRDHVESPDDALRPAEVPLLFERGRCERTRLDIRDECSLRHHRVSG